MAAAPRAFDQTLSILESCSPRQDGVQPQYHSALARYWHAYSDQLHCERWSTQPVGEADRDQPYVCSMIGLWQTEQLMSQRHSYHCYSAHYADPLSSQICDVSSQLDPAESGRRDAVGKWEVSWCVSGCVAAENYHSFSNDLLVLMIQILPLSLHSPLSLDVHDAFALLRAEIQVRPPPADSSTSPAFAASVCTPLQSSPSALPPVRSSNCQYPPHPAIPPHKSKPKSPAAHPSSSCPSPVDSSTRADARYVSQHPPPALVTSSLAPHVSAVPAPPSSVPSLSVLLCPNSRRWLDSPLSPSQQVLRPRSLLPPFS